MTSTAVRRCARCGAAQLVVVRAWQHKTLGLFTGVETLELECRSCSAKVVLHPWSEIRIERLFAFIFMPALFPGLFFLFRSRKKARAWMDNPLVEGTSAAATQRGEPGRRCECSAAAACVAIVKQGRLSFSLGSRHEYLCPRCAQRFAVHDAWGVAFMAVAAMVLAAVGTLVIVHPPGAAVGAESSNQGFGVALVVFAVVAAVLFVRRMQLRLAHPLA